MTSLQFDEWQDAGGTPVLRFNAGVLEAWDGSAWGPAGLRDNFIPEVEYVVVAGGGGTAGLGGAGAGGYASNSPGILAPGTSPLGGLINPLEIGTAYTVTIGAGGSGASNGSNSVFSTITCLGGGHTTPSSVGQSGGSGSGASSETAGFRLGGAGNAQQGFGGGSGNGVAGVGAQGGAGGGASGLGMNGDASNSIGPNGGDGIASSITGSSVYRAGGGAGGGKNDGAGGLGGGGASNQSGVINTGGGAGAKDPTDQNGGSGVVILKYPEAITLTIGGGLTSSTATSAGFKVTTFTAGTDTITANL